MKQLCDYCEEAEGEYEVESAKAGGEPLHLCEACMELLWRKALSEPELQ